MGRKKRMNLVFLNGPNAGKRYKIEPPGLRIGRETDNDIQILTGGVSRYHARITGSELNGWYITDLGSTNGTKINGNSIESAVLLEDENLILIGDQSIRVEEEALAIMPGKNIEKSPSAEKPVKEKSDVPSVKISVPQPKGKKPSAASSPVQFRSTSSPEGSETAGKEPSMNGGKGITVKEPAKKTGPGKENVHFQDPDTAILENIFNDSPESGKSSSGGGKSEDPASGTKKNVISSLLFYVVLGAVAVVSVAAFLVFNEPVKKKELHQKVKRDPNKFFLVYEKEEMTRASIFRFEMLLECCLQARKTVVERKKGDTVVKEEKMVLEEVAQVSCSVVEQKAEDNISYRFVLPPRAVELELVGKLRKKIQETEFMKLTQERGDVGAENGTKDNMSRITVGFNGMLNSILVRNTSPRLSYNEVETLIEDFTEEALGVRTVSMSVEEMRQEAAKHFQFARECFANYHAKPENIRLAIKRFRLTTQLLDRFQPRPKMWTEASDYLGKAEKIFERIKKDTHEDMVIKMRLKEYPEALAKAKLLMEYQEPDTEEYYKYRNYKVQLERLLASDKGRRKRR